MRCITCLFGYLKRSSYINCAHPNRKQEVFIGTLNECSNDLPRPKDCPIVQEDRSLSKIKKMTGKKDVKRS
jgi:hypothetical protein